MRKLAFAATFVAMVASTTASAQTPPPAAASTPTEAECAENPFKPGCAPLTITPGAPGTGLKPQWSQPGIIAKGLRPMDKPSFDRDSLRLPKSLN